ncbi:leucine-rich repeat-containing protein 15-like [Uloborus diversus]|uniref:leucine-rich repeat-containing protein 15-like n=1 Tax=Uloborus diversus TaxID=327109 RepID=UPI00240996D5|nr:leucine-rich repeat-containing protein 15-like [Uloborus diversus]
MAFIHTCLLLFSLMAFGACFPATCPSIEDLSPCTCKRIGLGLRVMCSDFNDHAQLIKVFKILRDYRVQIVILHDLSIKDVLPNTLFDDLQINELRVESCELKFSGAAFTGLDESLSVLNVAQQTVIESSEGFSLAKLSKLNELNVKANSLTKVNDDWLNGKTPNVHTIVLEENEISSVGSHAFAHLDQLKIISLADNRIKKVERSMFPRPASNLKRIDLSNNEISQLPEDIFLEMPNLNEVALSGNDLRTLERNVWMPIWSQLTKVYLVDNKMNCDSEMNWIRGYRQPSRLVGNCVEPRELRGRPIKDVYSPT